MPRGQYERRPASDDAATEVAAPHTEAALSATVEQSGSARAVETRRERRRRNDGDLDGMAHHKLAIPREILEQGKREGKVFRYFLESNAPEAHQNDWDKVADATTVVANPNAGEDQRLILHSKFKDWHEADLREAEQVDNAREKAMLTGQVPGDDGSSAGLHVPRGQRNQISRQQGL